MKYATFVISALAGIGMLAGCNAQDQSLPAAPGKESAMKLRSTAFEEGKPIPPKYTCDGENVSPPLLITGVPEAAKSLALVMDDPDAPRGTFDHWILWNMPPELTAIKEGVQPDGVPGTNGYRETGYRGPCPPSGTHHYRFKLYAVDATLDLTKGASKPALEEAMKGHILAEAVLTGTYARRK